MEVIIQIHALGSVLRNTNPATQSTRLVGPGTGLDGYREEIVLPLSVLARQTVQPSAPRYS